MVTMVILSIAALIVPVGFGLMLLQFLLRTIQGFVKAIQGQPEEEAQ